MKRYTVAVLVRNRFGVLNRVTSMFRRRQFNINALTVSETETSRLSRITVVFSGEETAKQQLINQLGIGNAAGAKQLGIHGDGGKTRDRVDLVEYHPVVIIGDKKIHAA